VLAHPHPNPESFTPNRNNLELALIDNNMSGDGFYLAVFSAPPTTDSSNSSGSGTATREDGGSSKYVVIDALGRVLLVPSTSASACDIDGLVSFGREAVSASPPVKYKWVIHHDSTCWPIDEFFVSPAVGDKDVTDRKEMMREGGDGEGGPKTRRMERMKIYGYAETARELEVVVEGLSHLPAVVHELFGLVMEAKEGYRWETNQGEVVEKVRSELKDLYHAWW